MNPENKNKQSKLIIILVLIILALLGLFGYFTFNGMLIYQYNLGFQDGQSSVVIGIAQTGEIPLLTEQGQLNLVSIQEICQGVQG